ncbi:hypothetical protein LFYK43_00530 [Ligilactobacillus salitolerans]|uniref:Uncharacterized protein n=1 Tax=Ligilactobacillus salitolerans TaxID=1808352 RepID=A0A401IQ11_9LACO|nr:hypothetical protein [Ligilactobacillus salitolerans]GBG93594.1 hypothetical protein LFYK43_00530 [Ligilactobacillus salitolerans]
MFKDEVVKKQQNKILMGIVTAFMFLNVLFFYSPNVQADTVEPMANQTVQLGEITSGNLRTTAYGDGGTSKVWHISGRTVGIYLNPKGSIPYH